MKLSKGLVAFAAAVALGALLVAKYPEPHSYQWERLDSSDGKFTISFPGKPAAAEKPVTSATGGTFISHSLEMKASERAAYGCSWWEDPTLSNRSPNEILNSARDNGIGGIHGRLVGEKQITIQGYPARELHASGQGNTVMDNRLIVVGTRLYTLLVIQTDGERENKNVERFFDSFTLR